jgi:hypothetical protein
MSDIRRKTRAALAAKRAAVEATNDRRSAKERADGQERARRLAEEERRQARPPGRRR